MLAFSSSPGAERQQTAAGYSIGSPDLAQKSPNMTDINDPIFN